MSARGLTITVGLGTLGVFALGCGGGSRSGESLGEQYQRAVQIADAEARVIQLLRLADKQHQAGDSIGREKSLVSAVDAAKNIKDAGGRATALNRVGMTTARMNQPYEAKAIFRDVQKMLGEVGDPEAKVALLTRMGYSYGKYLAEADEAADMLTRAEQTAGEIARPEGRIEALLEVAYTRFGLGQADETAQLLDRTLADARGLEDPRKRADALASAGATLGKMKKADESKTVFQEAQKTASEIPDPLSQAYAYVHLSTQLIESDLKGAAQKVLGLAEASADKVTDQSMRGPLMDKIYATRRRTSS